MNERLIKADEEKSRAWRETKLAQFSVNDPIDKRCFASLLFDFYAAHESWLSLGPGESASANIQANR